MTVLFVAAVTIGPALVALVGVGFCGH